MFFLSAVFLFSTYWFLLNPQEKYESFLQSGNNIVWYRIQHPGGLLNMYHVLEDVTRLTHSNLHELLKRFVRNGHWWLRTRQIFPTLSMTFYLSYNIIILDDCCIFYFDNTLTANDYCCRMRSRQGSYFEPTNQRWAYQIIRHQHRIYATSRYPIDQYI